MTKKEDRRKMLRWDKDPKTYLTSTGKSIRPNWLEFPEGWRNWIGTHMNSIVEGKKSDYYTNHVKPKLHPRAKDNKTGRLIEMGVKIALN